MYDSFLSIREDVAERLAQGASSRHSAMHLPAVATADCDIRIMVLRAFDPALWQLRFHTDVRSPKVGTIEENGNVGVLFYDRNAKIQIRVRGSGTVIRQGPEVDRIWEESSNFARRCYVGHGPGTETNHPSSGLPEWIEGRQPTDEELVPARENFAVLRVSIAQADWFYLSNEGHRRAVIAPDGRGRWVTP